MRDTSATLLEDLPRTKSDSHCVRVICCDCNWCGLYWTRDGIRLAASGFIYDDDDIANAQRFAVATLAGVGHQVPVILDTFDDIDRGYFTRTGLVDRRFNPRLAGQLLSLIMLKLNGQDWRTVKPGFIRNDQGVSLSIAESDAQLEAGAKWTCPETLRSGTGASNQDLPQGRLIVVERRR